MICFVADPHLCSSGISSRKDDVLAATSKKLHFVIEECRKRDCRHIVCLGDSINSPTDAQAAVRLAGIVRSVPDIQWHFLVGQHDSNSRPLLYGSVLEPIFSRCPHCAEGLDNDLFCPNAHLLDNILGTDMGGVRVYGLSFNSGVHRILRDRITYDADVLAVHATIVPGEFFGDPENYCPANEVAAQVPLVLAGDYHPGFNAMSPHGAEIISLGSLTRTDIGQRNRRPRILFVQPGLDREEVFVPVAEDVFRIKEHLHAKSKERVADAYKAFVEQVNAIDVAGMDIHSIIARIGEEVGAPPQVIEYTQAMVASIKSELKG